MPETTFPLNVTDVIREFLDDQLATDGLPTVFRPLRTTDGNGAIGIFPVDKKGQRFRHCSDTSTVSTSFSNTPTNKKGGSPTRKPPRNCG